MLKEKKRHIRASWLLSRVVFISLEAKTVSSTSGQMDPHTKGETNTLRLCFTHNFGRNAGRRKMGFQVTLQGGRRWGFNQRRETRWPACNCQAPARP